MRTRENLQGHIFGDILVLVFDKQVHTHAQWKCLCMLCNRLTYSTASNLKNGNKKSCQSCGQKISNGLEQDIYWKIKKGAKITHVANKFKVGRSVVYRIKNLLTK